MLIDTSRFAMPKPGEEFAAPISSNPAVAHCCDVAIRAYRTEFVKEHNAYEASKAAAQAYRLAMPLLMTAESVRDFIACVAHGMLTGIFSRDDSTRLLYAAQVAGGLQKTLNAKPKSNAA